MIIYLEWLLPVISSDLPKASGPRQCFASVLLRMGFTYAPPVTRKAVVSYTALPPLPAPGKPETEETCGFFPLIQREAVYFCCTFLRVASTGRYPASCPVKPGLSSPAVFRHLQPRSFVLLILLHGKRRRISATFPTIHYFFYFRKKYFPWSDIKTASTDEFPDNGILVDPITWHRKKIIQKLQQTLCL